MFSFFTKLPFIGKAITVVSAGAIIALLAYCFFLSVQIGALERDIKSKNEEIGQLSIDRAILKTGLEHQNSAVLDWKKNGEALQALINQAILTNQTIALASVNRVNHLVTAKIPEDCKAAIAWAAKEYNTTVSAWNKKTQK